MRKEKRMNDSKPIRVTLVYHPHKALGEKYEITKLVNAVTVSYDDPDMTNRRLTVRIGDCLKEAHATALADVAEVTVVPE